MAERAAMCDYTLVKYDNPILATSRDKKGTSAQLLQAMGRPVSPGQAGQVQNACYDAGLTKRETEEILNAILPPKEWEEDGKLWRQTVSTVPATRLDVINLQEQLDLRLRQRQAREIGLCPIRRELYSQCFDEVIRQVTINCAERGLLLLRVRDELRMTLAAYEALYESSTAFGMRKALTAESSKNSIESLITEAVTEKEELEREVLELETKIENEEARYQEQKEAEERRYQEEVSALKRANAQLKQQLEAVIAPRKAAPVSAV